MTCCIFCDEPIDTDYPDEQAFLIRDEKDQDDFCCSRCVEAKETEEDYRPCISCSTYIDNYLLIGTEVMCLACKERQDQEYEIQKDYYKDLGV